MQPQIPLTRDLVLIGGGHAHALAARMWGMKPVPGVRLTLINPGPTAPYSGMLPGHIAGHYTRDDLDIDLVKLARFAGARLILGATEHIDPVGKNIRLSSGRRVAYDVASIDVGIHAEMPGIEGFAEHGLGAKPLDRYASGWADFVERAKAIKVGNGTEDGTQMGPMANERGPQGLAKKIADAKDKGGKLETGGDRIGNQGFYFEPTVLSEVPTNAEIMNEEPFGPVAIVNPMANADAMIEEANRLPYGLAAYAWTNDPKLRGRLAADVEAGMLAINGANVSAPDAPFGGVKWSGFGREDGAEGVMHCMVPKTIHES